MFVKNRDIQRLEPPAVTKAIPKVQAKSVFSVFAHRFNNSPVLFRFSFFSMIFCLGMLLGGSYRVWGQTVLLSPTGDGGFENGTSFGANGWTTVNNATNYWVIGTATLYAGTRSAYVSYNGTTNLYRNYDSETSHFYRDITVPAGENLIELTFYLKGTGEVNYDRLLVYTAPTSVTPVAGTPASTSTTIAGATLVYTQTATISTFGIQTVTLPSSLAGTTFRLIFTWQNDNNTGTDPPAAVDNISLTSQIQTNFTTPGTSTFTVPSGVTCIKVEAWGAGGGGGRSTSNNLGRGGGGGGAYARSILSVNPDDNFSLTVGAGGTGGDLTAAQNTGGSTSFGSDVVAVGGGGVANNNNTAGQGGNETNCTGDIAISGGNGADGNGGNAGGGGGGAGSYQTGGNAASTTAGTGGDDYGGDGGAGRTTAGAGNAGNNYGGGGGGGRKGGGGTSNQNGGAGAPGQVIITWTGLTQTNTPTVTSPIYSYSTTISGTSEANASITVYANGSQIGTATANSSGAWSTTVSSLTVGQSITATAKVIDKCLSNTSTAVTVLAGTTVSVAVSPSPVYENSGTGMVYTFTRSSTSGTLTVDFSVGGTAAYSTDYTQSGAASFSSSAGTVTFANGVGTATVTVTPVNESTPEDNETIILTVINGTNYGAGTPSSATGTITNDDNGVSVTVSPTSVLENSGSGMTYTFTRTGLTTSAITVNFTVGGTATYTTDYTQTGAASYSSSAGTVTISAGNSSATVVVTPVGDVTYESDETIILTVTTGTNYGVVTPSSATATITNDDAAPCITSQPTSVTVCVGDDPTFSITTTAGTRQWQVSTNSGGSWTNITAAGSNPTYSGYYNNSTLTLTNVVAGNDGYQYRCVVSGSCSSTSDAATLNVGIDKYGPKLSVSEQLIDVGQSTTLSLSNTQTGLNYQLYADGSAVGSPVAGNGGTISFASVSPTTSTNYTVDATSQSSGCNSDMIDQLTVIVNEDDLIIELNPCAGQPGANFFTNSEFGTTTTNHVTPSFQSYFPTVIFGAELGTTYTNYIYGIDDDQHQVNDGYYVIANSTYGMYNGPYGTELWIDMYDNTEKDGTGMMYIVNAALASGTFYTETLTGLCDSTKYEFSADIINLYSTNWAPNGTAFETWFELDDQGNYNTILPNIDFLINGKVAFNTGNLMNNGTWNTFGFTFRTGGLSSITLTMRNNSIGGAGNDLALDNIVMRPCGPQIQLNIITTLPVCSGTPVTMTAQIIASDYNSPVYQWQISTDNGSTWTNISGATGLQYTENTPVYGHQYRYITGETIESLSNEHCYVASDPVVILTTADILGTTNESICGSGTVTLEATANSGSTINWYADLTGGSSLGTGNSFTTPTLSSTTTYYVDATQSSCTSSPRQAVVATVISQPTITSSIPASRCGTGTVSLQATASEGTVYWYAAASGGTSIGSGSPWTTPSIATTTTYYAEANNNGCTSTSRTAVTATISGGNLGTVGSITGSAIVCESLTGISYSIPSVTNAVYYNWSVPSGWGIESGQGTNSITASAGSSGGTISVTVTGGCSESTTVTRAVTVLSVPSAPVTGTITQPTCLTTTGSVALSGLPSSGTWTLTRNPGGVMTTGTGTSTTVSNLSSGTYTFTVTNEDLTATCPGAGTGLYAEYFNNMTLSGTPALTRTDATVNFNWGANSPDGTIGTDNFSVRWTDKVQPCYTETYTFYTQSDDGIRLWVNGTQIVNNWTDHSSTENSGTISLVAGEKYDIVLEFYENGGDAVAQLSWSSASQAKEIIPSTQLYPGTSGCTSDASSDVTIDAQPPIPDQPTITPDGTTTFCEGNNVTLTSSAEYSYLWSTGATTQSITVNSSGNYTVQVTNSDGCQSVASNAVSVTVNPNAAIALISASGTDNQTVCNNTSIGQITYSVSGGGTGAGATGLPTGVSGNYNSGTFIISGTPSESGTFNYTVTTTGTCTQASAYGTITVDPLPTASSGGSQSICVNGAVTVSGASASNGTILWTENGAGSITSGATTLTPTYTPAAGDAGNTVTLTMTVTSNNACSPQTATATYAVTVEPEPSSGTLSPNPVEGIVCSGTNVSATLTAGSGGAGTITDVLQYRYDGGSWNSYTSGSNLATAGHTSVDIQTYRTATGSGCTTSTPVVVSWTVTALPDAVISLPTEASDCPQLETDQGFNAETGSLGYTIIRFTVDRPTGASSWSFNYLITGITALNSGSPNGLSGTIIETDNTATVEIWITNVVQTEYTLIFTVDEIQNNDSGCSNGTDVSKQFILLPMPAVGPFE